MGGLIAADALKVRRREGVSELGPRLVAIESRTEQWVIAFVVIVTAGYLFLLASNVLDGIRGNEQWHIPRAANPNSSWWWLPIPPGLAIAALPLLRLRRRTALVLGMALTCVFGVLLYQAQWGGAGDNLLSKIITGKTGYYEAAVKVSDVWTILRDYPAYVATFEQSSHLPSHPPADLLLFLWLIDLMRLLPGLAGVVVAGARPFVSGLPMLISAGGAPTNLAAAMLSIPLLVVFGRLAAVPMARLADHLGVSGLGAGLAVLSLPVLLNFIPALDTIYPVMSILAVVLCVVALERRSPAIALLAGVCLGLGLFFTLGLLVALVPMSAYAIVRHRSRVIPIGLVVIAGWAAAWLGLWLIARINMLDIAAHISVHQREWEGRYTYWLWFCWKWYDFVMFCGMPVAALTARFLLLSARHWIQRRPAAIDAFFAGWLGMMIALWISPYSLAETGRTFAPLTSLAVLFAAAALPKQRWALSVFLLLQLAQVMVMNRYLEIL